MIGASFASHYEFSPSSVIYLFEKKPISLLSLFYMLDTMLDVNKSKRK